MRLTLYKIIVAFTLITLGALNITAQTEREKGIESYKKGNFAEAAQLLNQASKQAQYKKDGETWNYLGMSYINQNKAKDGRKALEKAVKSTPQSSVYRANLAYAYLLERNPKEAQSQIKKAISTDPKNATAYFIRGTANLWEGKNQNAVSDAEMTISLDPKLTTAYVLHSDALLASFGDKWADDEKNPEDDLQLLTRASDSLNKCLESCPKNESLKIVGERFDSIKAFVNYFENKKGDKTKPPVDPAQNQTELQIIKKSPAAFTADARKNNETGTVRLAVLFGADARISYIIPLKRLRYGLTEQSINAARNIAFEPRKIDGKPVSVVKVVVYSFEIK